jgi:hypothetical protein
VSVDAGAREIRHLLITPNRALGSALRAELTALRHGLGPRHGTAPILTLPSAAVGPIDRIRSIYHDLLTRIAAIDTKQHDAKRSVLNALILLDSSLALFAQALAAPNHRKTAELARRAYWQRAHAHTELKRAVEDLR